MLPLLRNGYALLATRNWGPKMLSGPSTNNESVTNIRIRKFAIYSLFADEYVTQGFRYKIFKHLSLQSDNIRSPFGVTLFHATKPHFQNRLRLRRFYLHAWSQMGRDFVLLSSKFSLSKTTKKPLEKRLLTREKVRQSAACPSKFFVDIHLRFLLYSQAKPCQPPHQLWISIAQKSLFLRLFHSYST